MMESMLHVNIPVQMIACTDTDGRITPIRFRFRDKTGELVTVTIDRVLSENQDRSSVGGDILMCGSGLWPQENLHPLVQLFCP